MTMTMIGISASESHHRNFAKQGQRAVGKDSCDDAKLAVLAHGK